MTRERVWPTTEEGWAEYFNTKKPDGSGYPYPYGTEDGEPYIFRLDEFPTRESVVAWIRWCDRTDDGSDWQIDEPNAYPVHIHADDRDECLADPCPEIVQVNGWWAE